MFEKAILVGAILLHAGQVVAEGAEEGGGGMESPSCHALGMVEGDLDSAAWGSKGAEVSLNPEGVDPRVREAWRVESMVAEQVEPLGKSIARIGIHYLVSARPPLQARELNCVRPCTGTVVRADPKIRSILLGKSKRGGYDEIARLIPNARRENWEALRRFLEAAPTTDAYLLTAGHCETDINVLRGTHERQWFQRIGAVARVGFRRFIKDDPEDSADRGRNLKLSYPAFVGAQRRFVDLALYAFNVEDPRVLPKGLVPVDAAVGESESLVIFGHANGLELHLYDNCHSVDDRSGQPAQVSLFHNCNTNTGSSGGPIFTVTDQGYNFVGFHRGVVTDDKQAKSATLFRALANSPDTEWIRFLQFSQTNPSSAQGTAPATESIGRLSGPALSLTDVLSRSSIGRPFSEVVADFPLAGASEDVGADASADSNLKIVAPNVRVRPLRGQLILSAGRTPQLVPVRLDQYFQMGSLSDVSLSLEVSTQPQATVSIRCQERFVSLVNELRTLLVPGGRFSGARAGAPTSLCSKFVARSERDIWSYFIPGLMGGSSEHGALPVSLEEIYRARTQLGEFDPIRSASAYTGDVFVGCAKDTRPIFAAFGVAQSSPQTCSVTLSTYPPALLTEYWAGLSADRRQ